MTSSLGVVVEETLTAERGGFVILAGSINFSVNNVCSLSPLSFKEIGLGNGFAKRAQCCWLSYDLSTFLSPWNDTYLLFNSNITFPPNETLGRDGILRFEC